MRTLYSVSTLLTVAFCITAAGFVMACPCSQIPKPNPATDPDPDDARPGLAYSHTKEYAAEIVKAVDDARAACMKHVGEPKVAVVSDIDETLIDNRPELEKNGKFEWGSFTKWVDLGKAKTLPPADFIKWARQKGFAIFLITGRKEDMRAATIENLVHDGISYDGLYMRAMDDTRSGEDMKTDYRKKIEAMGFKIIVSIGDQNSDLYGGHAEDCEKLPNKMYYVP
jgi:predicted secreted acid phosphatase